MMNRKRYSAILVLAVALLAGCEGKPPQSEPVMNVTLDTLISGEEEDHDQETIGRTVVMVARGWSDWPASYSFEGQTQPLTIDMGRMKSNTQYRVTVQEVQP